MTPEEALNLLDQAASSIQSNRQTHQALATAVQCLQEFIRIAGDVRTERDALLARVNGEVNTSS